jgi:hypothetical protein
MAQGMNVVQGAGGGFIRDPEKEMEYLNTLRAVNLRFDSTSKG